MFPDDIVVPDLYDIVDFAPLSDSCFGKACPVNA